MKFLLKFINFYIYSSIHIGIAAVALCYQTAILLELDIPWYYYAVTFSATIFIYCLHRIIGINRMPQFLEAGRFEIIKEYKSHILFYAIVGFAASAILFWFLDHLIKLLLLMPTLVSIAYVLPIFKNKLRLRDLHFVKIFLIGLVWAYITVFIPAYYSQTNLANWPIALLCLERFLFVFAITIPFDLRDAEIDNHTNVKTLVHKLGFEGSKRLCLLLVLSCVTINYFLMREGLIGLQNYYGLLIFYATLTLILTWTMPKKSDYYFSGILDGTMILSPLLIYLSEFFIS